MKFKFKCLVICVLFNLNLNAQKWTRTLTTTNSENEVGILKSSDGSGALINVNNVTISGQSDFVISKLNSDGTVNWSYTYSMNSSSEIINSFILDRDNNIVLVGSTNSSGVQKGLMLKVDYSNGNILFSLRTQASGNSAYIRKVIQLNSGYSDDYVILGTVNYPVTNFVARLDENNGSTIWAHNHNVVLGNTDLWYTLNQVNNNDIVIGGGLYNGSNNDHTVIHLNPLNGARKLIKRWNIANGTAANGGFDDAVVIPGTDTMVFAFVQNGGGAATKHGFAIYDAGAKNLVSANINYLGSTNTRALRIDYNPNKREVIIGGVSGSSYEDHFIQLVDIDNKLIKSSGKLDWTINRSAFKLANTWVSYISTNQFVVGNTIIPLGTYPNGNEVVISLVSGPFVSCYDSIDISNDTLVIPGSLSTTMDSTNLTIDSVEFERDSFQFNDTLRCYSDQDLIRKINSSEYMSGVYENLVFPFPLTGVLKEDLLSFDVYPNPSNGNQFLNLDIYNLLSLETSVTIYDSQGNMVYWGTISGDSTTFDIDISGLEKGLYIIKLVNSQNSSYSKIQIN
jgi:hypothetical protein